MGHSILSVAQSVPVLTFLLSFDFGFRAACGKGFGQLVCCLAKKLRNEQKGRSAASQY